MNADSVDLSDRLGDCGCGCGGSGACGSRMMSLDKPFPRGGISVLPVTKAIGYIMGIPQMEKATAQESAGPVMTRASNVASLTAAMLLKFKPDYREEILIQYGGLNWTNDVLKLAKNYPGGLGLTDAVRFSLALHFVIGIVDAEGKKDTVNARAYLAFSRIFKDAVDRRSGHYTGEVDGKVNVADMKGLAGLGTIPESQVNKAHDKWCDEKAGKEYPANLRDKCRKGNRGDPGWCDKTDPWSFAGKTCRGLPADFLAAVASVPGDVAKAVNTAADAALDFLSKGAAFISDIICQGLKKVMGEAVGGVICEIIRFALNAVTAGLAAYVEILRTTVNTVMEFIKLLVAGKNEQAFMTILKGMGQVLFLLSAPLTVPIFMAGNTKPVSAAIKDLKAKAERVTNKNPLFPLVLVMAVVQLVTSPTPDTIMNVILSLSPMIAVFIAPLIMPLAKASLDFVEAGIEKFIKLSLVVIRGAMALRDIIPKLRGQLEAFYKGGAKTAAPPKPGTPQRNIAERVRDTIEKFQNGFNAFKTVFTSFSKNTFQQLSVSVTTILTLVPDIMLAIMSDEDAAALPSLTEWTNSVKTAVTDGVEREKVMTAAAADIVGSVSPETRARILAEQAQKLPNIPERARVAAQILAPEIKQSSTFPQFVASLRMELLKVP